MKITIARLRSFVKYNGPLETVLDSFFENYVKWMKENPQHEYKTYNVSFDNTRPKRTPETIEWADVIVIPSDSEFRYHGELQMNPKDLAKSESHMELIKPFFKDKSFIMWRSDRGDTEKLYRSFLPDIKNFYTIDEIDFSGNIHGMKYHFIQTLKNPMSDIYNCGYGHGYSVKEVISEMENIVYSGTKVDINYYIDEMLDDDQQEEIFDYFKEEAKTVLSLDVPFLLRNCLIDRF